MIKDTYIKDISVIESIYMCARSTCIIDYHARNAWIGGVSIGNIFIICICIKGTSIKNTYIRAACIKTTFIKDASIYANCIYIGVWNADIGDEFIRDTYVRYASSINVVKYLKIYLQSSQILELSQYNPVLKTKVRAG